jgi:hypothetical protein
MTSQAKYIRASPLLLPIQHGRTEKKVLQVLRHLLDANAVIPRRTVENVAIAATADYDTHIKLSLLALRFQL